MMSGTGKYSSRLMIHPSELGLGYLLALHIFNSKFCTNLSKKATYNNFIVPGDIKPFSVI